MKKGKMICSVISIVLFTTILSCTSSKTKSIDEAIDAYEIMQLKYVERFKQVAQESSVWTLTEEQEGKLISEMEKENEAFEAKYYDIFKQENMSEEQKKRVGEIMNRFADEIDRIEKSQILAAYEDVLTKWERELKDRKLSQEQAIRFKSEIEDTGLPLSNFSGLHLNKEQEERATKITDRIELIMPD